MFGASSFRRATAACKLFGRHVIEQHDIGAGGEDVVQLIETIDFDFDEQVFADILSVELRDKVAS